jgi:hypothetical protein
MVIGTSTLATNLVDYKSGMHLVPLVYSNASAVSSHTVIKN